MIYVATLPDGREYYEASTVVPDRRLAEAAVKHFGLVASTREMDCVCIVRISQLIVRWHKLDKKPPTEILVTLPKPLETFDAAIARLRQEYGCLKVHDGTMALNQEFTEKLEAWLKAGGG